MSTTTAPRLHGLVHAMPDAEYRARPELSSTGVPVLCGIAGWIARGPRWK